MKELLERLSKVMPEGFELKHHYDDNLGDWVIIETGDCHSLAAPIPYIHHYHLSSIDGDIGLAALTALLKQDIPDNQLADRHSNVWVNPATLDFSNTEFETNAKTYLALKESQ